MIFGKTHQEKFLARQEELKKKINGVKEFVLFGRLENGKFVVCQTVWAFYHGFAESDGTLKLWWARDSFSPLVSYYLDYNTNYIQFDHL